MFEEILSQTENHEEREIREGEMKQNLKREGEIESSSELGLYESEGKIGTERNKTGYPAICHAALSLPASFSRHSETKTGRADRRMDTPSCRSRGPTLKTIGTITRGKGTEG